MMFQDSISCEDASTKRQMEFNTCLTIANKICERVYEWSLGPRKYFFFLHDKEISRGFCHDDEYVACSVVH